ncbi:MAG: Asp-tRNA(Asn) amidotransferase subunit GatC [Nanoarchaeota archaeon]
MDKEKIEKQAKEILDKFSNALDKVKKFDENFYVVRKNAEREENGKSNISFKSKLLENAPSKNEDFVVVEKRSWKNG